MVSCTEFIPLYSELFKFLEKKNGRQEVLDYWNHISDKSVQKTLGTEIEKHGLKGCWTYWNKSLNEEACDFTLTYDEEKEYFEINMRGCPSRGMLNKLTYMEPYYDYCLHCDVLYARVAAKYGIKIEGDYSQVDKACCRIWARPMKKDEK